MTLRCVYCLHIVVVRVFSVRNSIGCLETPIVEVNLSRTTCTTINMTSRFLRFLDFSLLSQILSGFRGVENRFVFSF